jgi:hypothetical protein
VEEELGEFQLWKFKPLTQVDLMSFLISMGAFEIRSQEPNQTENNLWMPFRHLNTTILASITCNTEVKTCQKTLHILMIMIK